MHLLAFLKSATPPKEACVNPKMNIRADTPILVEISFHVLPLWGVQSVEEKSIFFYNVPPSPGSQEQNMCDLEELRVFAMTCKQ